MPIIAILYGWWLAGFWLFDSILFYLFGDENPIEAIGYIGNRQGGAQHHKHKQYRNGTRTIKIQIPCRVSTHTVYCTVRGAISIKPFEAIIKNKILD